MPHQSVGHPQDSGFSQFLQELLSSHPEFQIVHASERRQKLAAETPASGLLLKVDAEELDRRCKRSGKWLRKAAALIEDHSYSLFGIEHITGCCDPDGVILQSAGSPSWRAVQGILPGYNWSERQMGPNGLGTALTEQRPLILLGTHHHQMQAGTLCSFAVPILDNDNILGVVELQLATKDCSLQRIDPFLGRAMFLIEEDDLTATGGSAISG
jgi:transcriptional regulator of acetoin/glycerol metabolism